jgi:hypothetical protein
MSDLSQPATSLRDTPQEQPQPPPAPEVLAETTNAPKDAQSAQSLDVRALTDRALHFLANASNETLGACLVGLSAATYLILGRVGLVLIGVAGGIVLHATWESNAHSGDHKGKRDAPEHRRRELGADIAHRLLDWRHTRSKSSEKSGDNDSDLEVKLYSGKELDFSDFRPETAAALTELTEAVVRDYVKYVPVESPFYSSNSTQMVVLAHQSHRHFVPRCDPADVDSLPHLRIHAPLPKATRGHSCRLCDALLVLYDHLLPRAFSCGFGVPR